MTDTAEPSDIEVMSLSHLVTRFNEPPEVMTQLHDMVAKLEHGLGFNIVLRRQGSTWYAYNGSETLVCANPGTLVTNLLNLLNEMEPDNGEG